MASKPRGSSARPLSVAPRRIGKDEVDHLPDPPQLAIAGDEVLELPRAAAASPSMRRIGTAAPSRNICGKNMSIACRRMSLASKSAAVVASCPYRSSVSTADASASGLCAADCRPAMQSGRGRPATSGFARCGSQQLADQHRRLAEIREHGEGTAVGGADRPAVPAPAGNARARTPIPPACDRPRRRLAPA